VWLLASVQGRIDRVCQTLRSEFEADRHVLERDVWELVEDLSHRGLLEVTGD
jgi:hypothetical protein